LSGTGISTYNQQTVPSLQSGAWFRLPLLEYEDDISDAYNALSGASMIAKTPATRDANPGDVILFEVDVSAHAGADGTYKMDLIGPNADAALIVTKPSVPLSGLQASTVTVMVQVPDDNSDGEVIDFFLQATHSTESQRRGLIRLVVDVDTDAEWDDDFDAAATAGFLGDEAQESPAPFVPAILALLGAALLARRRRLL
jgi:MYXO-CTERM domain-containing protein